MDFCRQKDRATFILNFHGLGEPKRKISQGEEDCWIDSQFFEYILDAVKERKDVQITFDDSNESDYSIAFPLLKRRSMSARFFVVAGRVGQDGFLSNKQIQCLYAEGMGIGSHGMHHRRWTGLSREELQEELVTAKGLLEETCGTAVTDAACPFGRYNRRVLKRLRAIGYQRVYTSDGGVALDRCWIRPRNTILRTYQLDRVLSLAAEVPSGPEGLWRRLKLTLKRWR